MCLQLKHLKGQDLIGLTFLSLGYNSSVGKIAKKSPLDGQPLVRRHIPE